MTTAYLGLGSNLGDRAANIRRALDLLSGRGVAIVQCSSLYETKPRDFEAQPWFFNMVVEVQTELSPIGLLSHVEAVEAELGRQRTVDKGPRTVDIDILLYGRDIWKSSDLEIPHSRMAERRFVLEPLAEIAPNLVHPVTHKRVTDMLAGVQDQVVERVGALE